MKSRFNTETTTARREAGERSHKMELFRKEMVSKGVKSTDVRKLWKEGKTNEQIATILLG